MKLKLFAGGAVTALAVVVALAPSVEASDRLCVAEALAARKDHAVLYVALKESGELDALRGSGPYTLFAPTDAAFAALDNATLKKLIGDKEFLKKLVRGHVVAGKHLEKDLKAKGGLDVTTLTGTALKVADAKDGLRVGKAKV